MLEVRKSNVSGRGIFTKKEIKKGEIIEICQIIKLSKEDREKIDSTELYNYYFSWKEEGLAISLGLGSLYNHSYQPNAQYIKDFDKDLINFVALKDIKPEEEILVNYNGDPTNQEKVWFEI